MNRSIHESIEEPLESKPIGQLPDDLQLVTGSHEVKQTLSYIGYDGDDDFGIAFIDTQNGEYSEVWVSRGCVPYLAKTAYRMI